MSLQDKLKNFEAILKETPPEKQQEKLNELLATLTPEELEELQKQQCVICNIISGKTPAHIIYQDEHVMAALEINPASAGHTILFPKKHASVFATLPEEIVAHAFLVANNIATAQYDILESDATNIHVANGAAAGQKLPHATINIIPRYEGDGITFEWTYGKPTPDELKKLSEKLKDKIKTPQKLTKEKVVVPQEPITPPEDLEPRPRRRIP